MKLDKLTKSMQEYNGQVAYGSECNAWGDYHAWCFDNFGFGPTDEKACDTTVESDDTDYWLAVTNNTNTDYDNTGDRKGA